MKHRNALLFALCCATLMAAAACAKKEDRTTALPAPAPATSPAQPGATQNTAPTDVVKASADALEIAAGGTSEAIVKALIADGFHINANPPTFDYLKATELTVETGEGITAGKPAYPASQTRTFAFAEKPLAVYEGEAIIKLPLRAAAGASKGERTLKAKLRVQPCDDKACYPPRTLDLSIPLTVK